MYYFPFPQFYQSIQISYENNLKISSKHWFIPLLCILNIQNTSHIILQLNAISSSSI